MFCFFLLDHIVLRVPVLYGPGIIFYANCLSQAYKLNILLLQLIT